jgi:serine protease Do
MGRPVFLGLLLALALALAQRLTAPEEVARSQVIKRALPAVVRIQGTAPAADGGTVGTGFFVSPVRVVTNYHVVQDLSDLTIRLHDGRTFPPSASPWTRG